MAGTCSTGPINSVCAPLVSQTDHTKPGSLDRVSFLYSVVTLMSILNHKFGKTCTKIGSSSGTTPAVSVTAANAWARATRCQGPPDRPVFRTVSIRP